MRINFQKMYTEMKNDLTFDNTKNIELLKSKIEQELQTKINDEFISSFKFFILDKEEVKQMTLKQVLNKFFLMFRLYHEEHNKIETTKTKDENYINELIKDFTFKKYITFKLRSKKIVFYIYNKEDIHKIKRLNNKNLAIDLKEFYVYEMSGKFKSQSKIIELIKENLKYYII